MDLEVQVVGRVLGVSRVSDEADDVTGLDPAALGGERLVGGQVRVVELVAGAIP